MCLFATKKFSYKYISSDYRSSAVILSWSWIVHCQNKGISPNVWKILKGISFYRFNIQYILVIFGVEENLNTWGEGQDQITWHSFRIGYHHFGYHHAWVVLRNFAGKQIKYNWFFFLQVHHWFKFFLQTHLFKAFFKHSLCVTCTRVLNNREPLTLKRRAIYYLNYL